MCVYLNDFTAPMNPTTPEQSEEADISDNSNVPCEIRDNGAFSVGRNGKYVHCLTIIGQVEGHYLLPPSNKTTKYEHVIPQLVAVEESEQIDGLLIILNTVGGDTEAGLAIAELITGLKKPTASLVLGGGHSIGVPLAVSADRSFIVPTATMTIHPVRMNGLVLVSQNSNIKPERFRELLLATGELVMDVGTVLDGENAVKEGLIDCIGNLKDAMSYLYSEMEK